MNARLATVLSAVALLLWSSAASAHDLDLLFSAEGGYVTISQPMPHPVRRMVNPQPNTFLLDVGMDFVFDWQGALLQRCRVQQVWISPSLVGNKSGIGTVFSNGNTPNYFDLPYGGTPHHHFIFAATAPGVYVFDLRAINGVDRAGRALLDMPAIYRIYMVAGNVSQLFGSVQPAPGYVGGLYDLMLQVRALRAGNEVGRTEQPVNPWAIYPYLVGFNTTGNADIVAKLDKHLSVKMSRNLSGSQRLDLNFPVLGDTDGDDHVGEADLSHVVQYFASNRASADLTGDRRVNLDDLYPVLVHFGQSGEGMR